MSYSLADRTLAFAGICQAAFMVHQLARHGQGDDATLRASLHSLLVVNPATPLDVFGSHQALHCGYQTLAEQLGSAGENYRELTRYVFSLIMLERKLSKNQAQLSALGTRLADVERQLGHFDLLDEPVLANFASIYSDVISPIGPRIQVKGNPTELQKPLVQKQVRALLLAGIRAAVLWRQLGGSRRHLMFSRRQMVEIAKRY
ncbi:MAG: high frequency lysogenization protein HflD [Aeromonas sp.]